MIIPKPSLKLVVILVAAALAVFLLLAGPATIRSLFTAKKQADVAQGQAGASIASGAEAMNTVSNVQIQADETRQNVKEAQDAIEAAPSGDSNDAADRAVCGLRAYRDNQRCARLRVADSAKPDRPDAVR
jgi:hypothetical protein